MDLLFLPADGVAVPRMRIGRNVGRRRRSNDRTGGGGERTAGTHSARPIATRSENCTRSGSRWITPPTYSMRCAAPGGAPMMAETMMEGGVGLSEAMRRENYNDEEDNKDGRGQCVIFRKVCLTGLTSVLGARASPNTVASWAFV